jgi:hypothetical protein
MMGHRIGTIIGLTAAVSLTASAGTANRLQHAQSELPRAPPTGVLCAWALTSIAHEVGRRCRPGQDPAFQAELDRTIQRFEDYALRNSDATPAQVAEFRRGQGMAEAPNGELCVGDPLMLYNHMAAAGVDSLRSAADELVARDAPPQWGDCL